MAEQKIEMGMLVRVGLRAVPITTVNWQGREYHHEKHLKPGQFLFGTIEEICRVQEEVLDDDTGEVVQPAKYTARVKWAGPKHRTSVLPVELLTPAINQAKRNQAKQ